MANLDGAISSNFALTDAQATNHVFDMTLLTSTYGWPYST